MHGTGASERLPERRLSTDVLCLLAIMCAAVGIGVFVHNTINQVREALPATVLKQQREVANIVHDFADFAHQALEYEKLHENIDVAPLQSRIDSMEHRLHDIRKTYNFDNLVGASAIHAVAKPALDDMARWLTHGLAQFPPNSGQVLRLVRLRAEGASRRIRDLFDDSNAEALALVQQQERRLERFRESLVLYLSVFGLFAVGVIVLFVRQRNSESRMAMERKRLVDSLENVSEGFALYDQNDRLILFNERFRMMGAPDPARVALGASFREIMGTGDPRLGVDSNSGNPVSFRDRIERHQNPSGPLEFQTVDNRTMRVNERKTGDGGTVAIYTDITDLKQIQYRLEHLATHDVLTGLPNRAFMQENLEKALSRAERHRGKLAVLVFDLDHFKLVNDTLGHASGDELLRNVARSLEGCMRSDEMVARLGGDEFAAVLEGVSSWSEVSATAERALDTLCRAFDVNGSEVFVTTSIGISLYPDDGKDSKTLLKNADAACYHAKAFGRNNFQFFAEDMNLQASQRLRVEKHLRHALDQGELSLVFQPLIDLSSNQVAGMEALLRWISPELGQVSPDVFVPVAEETGLIIPIGEWVLDQACRQNQAWRSAGLPPIQMCVNVSARQLRLKGFSGVVKRVIRSSGLESSGLVLEITESTIMDNLERALGTLREIHDSGVQISIDDFGVGYSSLSALKRFPVHTLKIDRSFVNDIIVDSDDFEIVSAVTAMAHNLKLKVVAEGVESAEQLEMIQQLGCDAVQGFWFGEPMASDAAWEFLGEGRQQDNVVKLITPGE